MSSKLASRRRQLRSNRVGLGAGSLSLVAMLAIVAMAAGIVVGPEHTAAAEPPRDQRQISRQTQEEARIAALAQSSTEDRARRRSTRGDAARIPRMSSPTVHAQPDAEDEPIVGWSATLAEPTFTDRRRRLPAAPIPPSYIDAIDVGERFVFDVYFAGNPAGLAEAGVVEYQADKRGAPPQGSGTYRLTGHAVTSGVISLLTSMEDTMETVIDAADGAVISSVNIIDRSGLGLGGKYKRRVTETEFEGRGQIRITDAKDEKTTKQVRQVPVDTFDPLSAMAWVRSLDLAKGEMATAHVLDGRVLLRIEVIGRGPATLDPMPSVAQGLGVKPEDVHLLEGTLSWVDRWGVVREDRRAYTFRAFTTQGDRRLLLMIETDMWLGVLKLVLNRYDPPTPTAPVAG